MIPKKGDRVWWRGANIIEGGRVIDDGNCGFFTVKMDNGKDMLLCVQNIRHIGEEKPDVLY